MLHAPSTKLCPHENHQDFSGWVVKLSAKILFLNCDYNHQLSFWSGSQMVDTVVTYRKMFFSWDLLSCLVESSSLMHLEFFSPDRAKNTHWVLLCAKRPWPLQTPAHLLHCYLFSVSVRSCEVMGAQVMVYPIHGLSPYLSLQPPHCTFCLTLLTSMDIFFVKENLVYKTKYPKFPVCCNLNMKGLCWSRILLRWILFPPWILPIRWSSVLLLIALFAMSFLAQPCSTSCFSF